MCTWSSQLGLHCIALEACFVARCFAIVWTLRLRFPGEFIAGGPRKEQSTCLETVSQAIFRWQRGSSAGSVINWMFYCSIDRSLARSCCLMRIGLGSDIFSHPLTVIGKVSPQCVTSQAARTWLNVYSVALRQQPASEHFTLLGFLVGVAISMVLVGLHLRAGKEGRNLCPNSRWKKWLTRQVCLRTWQIFVLILVKATIVLILCRFLSDSLDWMS